MAIYEGPRPFPSVEALLQTNVAGYQQEIAYLNTRPDGPETQDDIRRAQIHLDAFEALLRSADKTEARNDEGTVIATAEIKQLPDGQYAMETSSYWDPLATC